ncbi:hypothetical protein K1719_041517 [Acacia pycnantha]|nr:hypothetical protein K1719_041517 [Acacia pycnantha]
MCAFGRINWIPASGSRQLSHVNELLKKSDQRVATLISPEHRNWETRPISHLITTKEVEAISLIPLSRVPSEDKVMWTLAKNGLYTVRLGYHLTDPAPSPITHSAGSSVTLSTWNTSSFNARG